jgi:radical SAM superfamily enzyme YgiQ (UPF0313 family)
MQQNKPHVILIYPKTGLDFGSTVAPPHACLAVAAPLDKAGYRVTILDQRTQIIDENLLRPLISDDLIFIGLSSMTGTQIKHALKISGIARELTNGKVPIVWGGTHPTILPEQTVSHPNVDIVVMGEGEITTMELVKALENKQSLNGIQGLCFKNGPIITLNETRPLMDVEELLPVPWHLIPVEKYIHRDMYVKNSVRTLDIGQTSRGCPFRCGFCSSASIRGRKWRAMSAEKSLDMIVGTVRKFNLDGLWLRDDEFYINRTRAHTIFEGMIRENLNLSFYTSGTRVDVFLQASDEELIAMKRAGAYTLKFGAESGSQRILDLMQKGITPEMTLKVNQKCKKLGIIPSFGLVIGYPTETFEDIDMTIDMAYRIKRENPDAQLETMAQFTPLPGTPSWDLAVQHGLVAPASLDGWCNWLFDDYDFAGEKLPWYNARERQWIGNISYMSILANALPNVVDSMRSNALRPILKLLANPASAYFRYRLSNKLYRNAPEMAIVRYLRRKIFYESEATIE